jgi:hypothetical protein
MQLVNASTRLMRYSFNAIRYHNPVGASNLNIFSGHAHVCSDPFLVAMVLLLLLQLTIGLAGNDDFFRGKNAPTRTLTLTCMYSVQHNNLKLQLETKATEGMNMHI